MTQLTVYDGSTKQSPVLYSQSLSRSILPPSIVGHNANMLVTWTTSSDNGGSTTGFAAQYITEYEGIQCGSAPIVLQSPWGSFSDLNGRGNYILPRNGTCRWLIATTQRITLYFKNISLVSGDVLVVYDGNNTAAPILQTVSGTVAYLPPLVSSG